MKKLIAGLTIVGAAFGLGSTAQAMNIGFDEGPVPQTGTLSYDGEGGAAIGTDLIFTTILGSGGMPLNDGVSLDCVGCVLNFSTGANVTEGPSLWQWSSAGSTFTVTGIVKDGATTVVDDGAGGATTILSGRFTGNPSVVGGGGTGLFAGLGLDEKHADLLAFYGLSEFTDFKFANTNLAIGTCTSPGNGGFDCNVLNADLNNTVIPAPAPLALLGLGLLGFAARRRARS